MRSAVRAQHVLRTTKTKDTVVHRGGKLDNNAVSIKQATEMTRMRSDATDALGETSQKPCPPAMDFNAVNIKGMFNCASAFCTDCS